MAKNSKTKKQIGDVELVQELTSAYTSLKKEIGKVVIGQEKIIEQLCIALLSKGHCLLIGVPGLAKTLLIKTLAEVIDLQFSRIQFTPDLMPSDITGTEIIEENVSTGTKSFKFIKGPLFANIVLADEINRTPPKTQAALLEAMQEHKITAGGKTYTLKEPFFVLATQNPIEQEGTYPLPEAQLDRFMFTLWLDYPTFDEEKEIVKSTTSSLIQNIQHVITGDDILRYQELIRRVPVAESVIHYAVELVAKTRPNSEHAPEFIKQWLTWGAGPRASQNLLLAAKTRAVLSGKYNPDIDDVKASALAVLRHRIILNFTAESENITVNDVIEKLIR